MKTIKAKVHGLLTGKSTMLDGAFETDNPAEMDSVIQSYHFYITTDEEIKEGDKILSLTSNRIYDAPYNMASSDELRKIIATTDPKLMEKSIITETSTSIIHSVMPQIPQSFIEEYCKAGGIEDVLVEYEEVRQSCNCPAKDGVSAVFNHHKNRIYHHEGCIVNDFTSKPKLNPDNTIIIHPVEEKMYSRDEVESLCRNAHLLGMKETLPGYPKPETIDKWIEENL